MSNKVPAASGFKSPAPVLPAMGLHSFHNDSPPFAPASQHPSREPDHFSLDSPPTAQSASTSAAESTDPQEPPSATVTIQQRGFEASSGPLRPTHTREPTSSADDYISTSRSRRLVSGYLFGNPHSPKHESTSLFRDIPAQDPSVSTPPSLSRDSTPVSTVSSSPDNSSAGHLTARFEQMATQEDQGTADARETLRRRRSSRVRDKEIGYDALTGLSDGEADADANAAPAAFGTQEYLLGADGQAGEYRFPKHRLRTRMKDESKIPIVIVACGSFSPPTYLHLRMFEMAKDEVVESQTYEIMAGYYSPVSSYYKKAGLAPAIHRVRMCELAVEHTSTWLMVDPWEAGQPEYTRTAVVLEHFNEMLNIQGGGLTMSDGKKRRYKIMLLAGGDLIESFGEPGVWSEPDLDIILGRFGCLIVERAGSDVWAFLLSHDILYQHRRNVIVIKQLIYNDISSTKVRLFVKRGMSIKYLLPNSVIQYIYDHKLYKELEMK